MMTVGEPVQACDGPDQAVETPRVRRVCRTRKPVDKILPVELIEEIQATVLAAPTVTAKLAKELDDRFDIDGRFGVSKRRLHSYLKRLHDKGRPEEAVDLVARGDPKCSATPCWSRTTRMRHPQGVALQDTSTTPQPRGETHSNSPAQSDGRVDNVPADDESKPTGGANLKAHRLRQASIASILDATFGPLAECNPELWDRRAYLMLVGMVYDRLALGEDAIPPEELIALAKVLSEARRTEVRAREHDREKESKDSAPPPTGPLPENFGDIVRQVYGTNFHAPSEAS